jgi:hypothetical protein
MTMACQGIWLAQLLTKLKNRWCAPFILKMDSQSAIAVSKNPIFHERSKHIDIRFHFIRECVGDGRMDLEHVRNEEQIADMLMKPLAWEQLCVLRAGLGVSEVKRNHQD